jgi:hypothetical protein
MKNRTIFLSVALAMCMLLITGIASAQFTEVWKVSAGTWPMMSTGDNTRGAALNTSNGHYLVTRRDLPRIYVYNASNGTLLDSLNMTGVSGGTVAIQDIEVTSDGVVYGTNLILQTGSDTTFKIYRWADDNSATVPTVAFSGRPLDKNGRFGDAFDVAGTGTGTVIYVGGNSAATDSLLVFTTSDGSTFVNSGIIPITANDAGMGIAQITPGGNFLTSRFSSGSPIRLYSSAGTRLDAVPTTVTPALQADITYLEAAGRKWVASVESVSTAGHGHKAVLLNTTYGLSGAVKVGVTPVIGTALNSGSLGADVELQYNASDSTITVYAMVDNNGFGAWKTGNVLATNLKPSLTNVARTQFVPVTLQNDTVTANVQDDQYIPSGNVKLNYSVDGGANTAVAMTLISGDSINGMYRGIIPGASNANGKRIAYYVSAVDNLSDTTISATAGYFAGITKMSFAGPRAIDTSNGVIRWSGYGIRVQGVCTQEDSLIAVPTSRHDVVLQDDQGAMDFIQFAVSGVPPAWRMKRGRVYTVTGLIGQFNGKIQVSGPTGTSSPLDVVDNGPGVLPPPAVSTVAGLTFYQQGEVLENALVKVHHLRFTPGSLAWPSAGAAGINITVTDNGTDSMTLRVPALSNANGFPPARVPFTVVGIAGQFDNTNPYKDGYQVIMRHIDDIYPEVMVAMKDTSKATVNTEIDIPVMVENITGLNITGFTFDATFDSTALQFISANNAGTIDSAYTFASNKLNGGLVRVVASGASALQDSGALFRFRFKVMKGGTFVVTLNGSFNEGNPMAVVSGGVVIGIVPPVPRQIVEVKNSKFTAGITNVGHIGALNGYQDTVGFIFKNFNALYEGSLIMGNAKNRVPNAARFSAPPSWNPGFRHRALVDVQKNGSKVETMTAFDDSTYSNPLGIWINQKTALDTLSGKDGYLILGYNVINKSASAINNFYLGSFFDFDLTAAGDADRGGIVKDSTNQIPGVNSGNPFKIHLAYIYNGTTFTGVVPLSQTVFAGGRIAVGPNEVYSGRMVDSNKFTYISTFRQTDMYGDGGSANDMSIFSSVGPYNIPANDTAKGAFAVVVGSSLTELLNNARAAQKAAVQEYGMTIQILTSVGGPTDQLPTAFALDQNYPNPFNPATTIRFALPNDASVALKVYDMLGREVRTLVNSNMNAGYHQVVWDGMNNLGSHVATGMYIYRIEAGSFVSTKKMMLLK